MDPLTKGILSLLFMLGLLVFNLAAMIYWSWLATHSASHQLLYLFFAAWSTYTCYYCSNTLRTAWTLSKSETENKED